MTSVFLIILLFVLLGGGVYVGLTLAGVGIVGLEFFRHLGAAVGASLYNSTNSWILSAVPMFLLLGEIVLNSGLNAKLYKGVSNWTKVIPGGLIHTNILACAIFAAVCGSSPATAATIGVVSYNEEKTRGYSPALITGSLAAGGTLGILIPPSINMIVYGAVVGASVGRLFIAGIIPGIILSLMFMIYIGLVSLVNRSLTPPREKISKRYFLDAVLAWKDIWPMFIIIIAIMGSIYGGITTPTEAAAASAFMAIVLAALFGKMNFTIIKNSAITAMRTTSMVILLFMGANILGSAMGLLGIPAQLAKMATGTGLGPLGLWLIIIVLYIILGMFMDTMAMMLITLPATYPIIVGIGGFDPIWFGIQLVILCEIGMITPPFAINVFIIKGIAKDVSVETIYRGIVPFLACMLLALGLFTFLPKIILFLPAYMLGR